MLMSIINEATKILQNLFEQESILMTQKETRELVEKWYSILPFIEDSKELAIISFMNPSNRILFSKDELRTFKTLFFPED